MRCERRALRASMAPQRAPYQLPPPHPLAELFAPDAARLTFTSCCGVVPCWPVQVNAAEEATLRAIVAAYHRQPQARPETFKTGEGQLWGCALHAVLCAPSWWVGSTAIGVAVRVGSAAADSCVGHGGHGAAPALPTLLRRQLLAEAGPARCPRILALLIPAG